LQEERVVSVSNGDGREYVFDLTGGRRRVVRLIHTDRRVVYLGVEGLFVSAERADVQRYLRSFKLTPLKK